MTGTVFWTVISSNRRYNRAKLIESQILLAVLFEALGDDTRGKSVDNYDDIIENPGAVSIFVELSLRALSLHQGLFVLLHGSQCLP
jgi:hypothetical protein